MVCFREQCLIAILATVIVYPDVDLRIVHRPAQAELSYVVMPKVASEELVVSGHMVSL